MAVTVAPKDVVRLALAGVGIALLTAAVTLPFASAQTPGAPRLGALAVLDEVQRLREENIQLRAQLVGRDRLLANQRYECSKRTTELQADLDEARLNGRAEMLLPDLRQVFQADESAVFDWQRGQFVSGPDDSGRVR